jgi:sporulation protein YtfJ
MDRHPIGDLMETTMQKLRELVDANTIVGQQITTPDGITIIPVSKVTLGFGAGGAEYSGKNPPQNRGGMFGGGSSAGVNIIPVAFLVIKGGAVKLLSVSPPAVTTVDRIIELVPDLADKVKDMLSRNSDE